MLWPLCCAEQAPVLHMGSLVLSLGLCAHLVSPSHTSQLEHQLYPGTADEGQWSTRFYLFSSYELQVIYSTAVGRVLQ